MLAILSKPTDTDILSLVQQAATFERGFRLLMQTYQEQIYWQVRQMVSSHEDADDVVQNCFVKVYRYLGNFKGEAKLYTWLYRIAHNEALSWIKRQQRHQSIGLDEGERPVSRQLAAEDRLSSEQVQERLRAAMTTLPEKQCLVFTLRYFEDMSYREMEELLGTSVGALKASYHHAVKKIEHALNA